MPQAFPEYGEKLDEADIVIGNKNNDSLIFVLDEFFAKKERGFNFARDLIKW